MDRDICSALSIVHTSLNAHCPVIQLPPEISSIVFRHVLGSRESMLCRGWPTSFGLTYAIVPITEVCHHWRTLAISFASLWSGLDDLRHAATSMFLRRSKNAPLQVYAHRLQDPESEVADLCRTHGSRIQELRYMLSSGRVVHDEIVRSLGFPAPALEHLSICVDSYWNNPAAPTSSPMLFDGCAPRLRVLILKSIPWLPANQCTELTHLCLCDYRAPPWHYPSDLITFLSGCPRLQNLVLVQISSDVDAINIPLDLPTASLPALRRLSIGNTKAVLIKSLLSHLVLPQNMATRIFSLESDGYSLVRDLAHLGVFDGQTHLRVSADEYKVLLTASGASSGTRVEIAPARNPVEDSQQTRDIWLRKLWAIWPTPGMEIRELWVDMHAAQLPEVRGLLAALPALETLVITQYSNNEMLYNMLAAEGEGVHSACGRGRVKLVCPNLRTLKYACGPGPSIDDAEIIASERARWGLPVHQIAYGRSGMYLRDGRYSPTPVDADVVEVDSGELSPLKFPEVCVTGTHEYWPAW
ncbi:hypothetical protein B0H21DRAFT_135702 [Amylocystis lapponica]|nr:hypothetical protein B0H21DRAFT_135702 [Amylocystis lapponica]